MNHTEHNGDGNRKPFPTLVDERAFAHPDKTFAIIPKSGKLEDGFRDLTYAELARAVDKASWWLDEHLGPEANTLEMYVYMGSPDFRYALLMLGAMKTRRQVCDFMFLSHSC
jgi:acyl-CoA synthetase (AMP-forming)/AMP-acid ligase II